MVNYRRDYTQGATYFFTLALYDRKATYLTTHISNLGAAFRHVRTKSNFITEAIIVLPDHLHFLWKMPENDTNYSKSIRLIKTHFTRALINLEIPLTKNTKGTYHLWQDRFWEHRIKNDLDYHNHIAYIHYNPVKHGYVTRPNDWPHSSIHRYIKNEWISENWGN